MKWMIAVGLLVAVVVGSVEAQDNKPSMQELTIARAKAKGVAEAPAKPQAAATDGWPAWNGPTGGFAATSRIPLVDDPAKAKLVWTSDVKVPGARTADSRKTVAKSESWISGGFGSPVVADGKVYLAYFVPSGTIHDEAVTAKHVAAGGWGKEKWLIDADDVLHCFDATTGKTLWRTVYPGEGMNWIRFNKGGPCNMSPTVSGGKAYFFGTTGKVYCVDAATGEKLWDGDLGERFRRMRKLRAVARAKKFLPQFNRSFAGSPTVAAGVVVFSDFMGFKVQVPEECKEFNWSLECGLIGFDAKTGKRLWHVESCLGTWASPITWRHGGAEYILAANGKGEAVCIEPKSGKVRWKATVGKSGHTMAIGEDHLVGNAGTETPQLGCWKISPAGARKAWVLPAAMGTTGSTPPVIWDGHVYARLKTGKLLCIELATGRVAAELTLPGGSGYAIAMGGRLLIDADNSHDVDEVRMFNADPMAFRQLGGTFGASSDTGYMVPITPAAADGRIYVRGRDRVRCYDLRK